MAHPYWTLFDLRIRTARVEIRLPNDDDLRALARLAAQGVHDPSTMPFLVPWTDAPSPLLERGVLQWGWRHRAEWTVDNWSFNGAVVVDETIVGVQHLRATDFTAQRVVSTGSWLGLEFQGRGIGKEMRAAVLHFAFEGLGARSALSGGFPDNAPSLGVSRSLGYVETGRRSVLRRGEPAETLELALDRSTWERGEHPEVVLTGLEACLDFFVAADVA